MGKTESGTLWVARDKTTPFAFYQYFYNVSDADVPMLLNLFTDIPSNEIKTLCEGDILEAKRRMAYEVTKLVHGEEDAKKAIEAAQSLFSKGQNFDNVPSKEMTLDALKNGVKLVDLACEVGFFASKGEARRMIQQGGLSVNGNKITDTDETLTIESVENDSILLQRGKKNFLRLVFKINPKDETVRI